MKDLKKTTLNLTCGDSLSNLWNFRDIGWKSRCIIKAVRLNLFFFCGTKRRGRKYFLFYFRNNKNKKIIAVSVLS